MEPLSWAGALGTGAEPAVPDRAGPAGRGLRAAVRDGAGGVPRSGAIVAAGRRHRDARHASAIDHVNVAVTWALLGGAGDGADLPRRRHRRCHGHAKGIIGWVSTRFLPVWIALIVIFAVSIRYKRRLGLYGKLFDSPIGMIGFGLVMFWVFTALFADLIITHDPLTRALGDEEQAARHADAGRRRSWYLLGGDNLARDVFSRMVMGAREVLQIAPAATLFAFMVGITLGLPAGYFGGKLDTLLSFLANLVLAFPVILLFYLLVTPEIVDTGIPIYLAAVLFLFPVIFLVRAVQLALPHPAARSATSMSAVTLVIGPVALSPASPFNADPLGIVVDGAEHPDRLRLGGVRERAHRVPHRPRPDPGHQDPRLCRRRPDPRRGAVVHHAVGDPAQRPRPADRRFLPAHRLHHDPSRHAGLLRPRRQPGKPRLGLDHQRRPPAPVDLPAPRAGARRWR